jgi:choloylglycine hydrolase
MSTKAEMLFRAAIVSVGLCAIFFSQPSAWGCTGILLRNSDGSTVNGRTVEFGMIIDFKIAIVPRSYEFVGKAPGGPGLKYKSKFAAVGAVTFNDVAIVDGMNEKGLAVGVFYFPTFAKYAEITNENRGKALSPVDFPNWIVTQIATIAEVRSAIQNGEVVVAPTVLDGWGPEPPPFHYVVYDNTGASLVIEPVDGQLKVHENPIGILTNSPTFDWHITNLRNYIALNPRNVPPVKIDGLKLKALGQGSGMLGLPGDFTPPSRFVRAAVFCAAAIPSPDSVHGIFQVFHILNNFDIPVAAAREVEKGIIHSDYTQVTVARDPNTLRYYYRTYDDQTIRMVDLRKFDPSAKDVKRLDTMKSQQAVIDMSSEAK